MQLEEQEKQWLLKEKRIFAAGIPETLQVQWGDQQEVLRELHFEEIKLKRRFLLRIWGAMEKHPQAYGEHFMARKQQIVEKKQVLEADQEKHRAAILALSNSEEELLFVARQLVHWFGAADVGATISEKTFGTVEGKKNRKNWVPPWMQEPA